MPSIEIGLGELKHIKDSQNLKLRTNVTLTFSHLSSITISEPIHIEGLLSTGAWIAGRNRLQIRSRLLFDDVQVSDRENASFIEEIGLKISGAEIWSQLGFDVAYKVIGDDSEGSHHQNELIFSIIRQTSSQGIVAVPHKVPSISLDSIGLLFKFSTCRRPRVPSKPLEESTVSTANILLRTSSTSSEADGVGILRHYPGIEQQWLRVGLARGDQIQDWVPDPGEEARNTLSTLCRSSSTPDSQLSVAPSSARSPKRASTLFDQSSEPTPTHRPQHVKFEHFSELLDAALRLIICDRETFKYQGVILAKDTGFPKLVSISPALFSPYYLEAISQRSHLVNKIAHSIAGVYRRTKSSGFRQKLDRLPTKLPEEISAQETIELEEPGPNSAETIAVIQARLWRLMQYKLLNPQIWSRRVIRLLNNQEKICAGSLSSLMLDSPLTDQSIRASPSNNCMDLVLESQSSSIEGETDTDIPAHAFDATAGVEPQHSDHGAIVHDRAPADDNAASEERFWQDRKTVSDDGSTEECFPHEKAGTLDKKIHEHLSQDHRHAQSLASSLDEDMLDHSTDAGVENIYCSQLSYLSEAQTELLDGCNGDPEEMLDSGYRFLEDQQMYPDNHPPGDYCDGDRDMTSEPVDSLLEGELGQSAIWNEPDQDMLDCRQELDDEYQSPSEPEQMHSEEILEDSLGSLHGDPPPFGGFATYAPRVSDLYELMDEEDIVLDYPGAIELDHGCAKDLWHQNEDDMLDSECGFFESDKWSRQPISCG